MFDDRFGLLPRKSGAPRHHWKSGSRNKGHDARSKPLTRFEPFLCVQSIFYSTVCTSYLYNSKYIDGSCKARDITFRFILRQKVGKKLKILRSYSRFRTESNLFFPGLEFKVSVRLKFFLARDSRFRFDKKIFSVRFSVWVWVRKKSPKKTRISVSGRKYLQKKFSGNKKNIISNIRQV